MPRSGERNVQSNAQVYASNRSMEDGSHSSAACTCGSGWPRVFSEMPSRAAWGMTVLSSKPFVSMGASAAQLQAALRAETIEG